MLIDNAVDSFHMFYTCSEVAYHMYVQHILGQAIYEKTLVDILI